MARGRGTRNRQRLPAPHVDRAGHDPRMLRPTFLPWFAGHMGQNLPPGTGDHPEGADFALLDRLQEKMEERLARKVPEGGRFCGYCYGRLRESEEHCPFCGRAIAVVGTAAAVPQEVLRAYRAKQRTESTWVYGMGFVGLAVAATAFIVLVIWGPGPLGHPGVAFTVLIGGGYILARLSGEVVGGTIGIARGVRRRNAMWSAFVATRERPR